MENSVSVSVARLLLKKNTVRPRVIREYYNIIGSTLLTRKFEIKTYPYVPADTYKPTRKLMDKNLFLKGLSSKVCIYIDATSLLSLIFVIEHKCSIK